MIQLPNKNGPDNLHEGMTAMPDTIQTEIAESVFERNQRREAEINDALKQEAARREEVIRNMHRLRELRLARDAKLHSNLRRISSYNSITKSNCNGQPAGCPHWSR